MSTKPANPLAKHFRQPVLYIKLPSGGRWWAENSLELPVTGEIPVYAMTARDEITMKTPDALLNGSSTVQVIESCCPSIQDAWKMPTVDLDTVLLAIRLATYGKAMDFTANCPHCSTANEKTLDISVILGNIRLADWTTPVQAQGLEIVLKPQTYQEYNTNNLNNFEEQKLLMIVQDETLAPEEKDAKFNELFNSIIKTGIEQISASIEGIRTNDGEFVTDKAFIAEFLDNCDKSVWEAIKTKLDKIRSTAGYNQIDLTCENPECNKEFTTPFVFEQTNFFG